MKRIGTAITHHFHKHRKRIADHIVKHHKKYIWGLGAASGIVTFKMFVLVFGIGFGLSPQNTYGDVEISSTPVVQQPFYLLNNQSGNSAF